MTDSELHEHLRALKLELLVERKRANEENMIKAP